MNPSRAALVVVDPQVGFVNDQSRHVLAPIADLVDRWNTLGAPVLFTRYHNYPGSPFERILHWTRLQGAPETDIAPELADRAAAAHTVLDKYEYSCLTGENLRYFTRSGWTDLVFCGIATDSCVLKSTIDAFEAGYTPWLVTDACASDSRDPHMHDAALAVTSRMIGSKQLVTTETLFGHVEVGAA